METQGLLPTGCRGRLFLRHQQDIPRAVRDSLLGTTSPLLGGQQLPGSWPWPRLCPRGDVQGPARRRPATRREEEHQGAGEGEERGGGGGGGFQGHVGEKRKCLRRNKEDFSN